MTRGLTLIEVLISLTLLAVVISATAAWTSIAGHATSTNLEPGRWRSAANNVVELIHDDLVTGDFEPLSSRTSAKRQPRVTVEDSKLSIRTRIASSDGVSLMRQYRLNAITHELLASTDSDSHQGRVLLRNVDEFTAEINDERMQLTVTINSARFGSLSRRYILP
jgi:prepilin-type N-terminal cleavage/methylation domain-containing protein